MRARQVDVLQRAFAQVQLDQRRRAGAEAVLRSSAAGLVTTVCRECAVLLLQGASELCIPSPRAHNT